MTFAQIIEFHGTKEQVDELFRIEADWLAATEGRRTAVHEQVYVDRADPTHWFSVNIFPSYEEAMANSNLPETAAQFERASAALGVPTFNDVDLVHDFRAEENGRLAQAVAEMAATGKVPDDVLADDAFFEVDVPFWRFQVQGIDAIRTALAQSIDPGHVERWSTTMTAEGFAVRSTVRDGQGRISHQLALVVARGGRIREATLFCTGDWSRETEQRHAEHVTLLRP